MFLLIVLDDNCAFKRCLNDKSRALNNSCLNCLIQLVVFLLLLWTDLILAEFNKYFLFWHCLDVSIESCVLPVIRQIVFLENFFSVVYLKALLP